MLALDRLHNQDPAAAQVARICAFLASEPVLADWFTRAAAQLPAVLAERAADPVAWRQCLAQVSRSALARVAGNALVMHRLTQAIMRGGLPPQQASETQAMAQAILAAADPGSTDAPRAWPGWARLLPHLLALGPDTISLPGLRRLARDAARYLIVRGDARNGHDLARRLYQH